jgi:hypothetical protein
VYHLGEGARPFAGRALVDEGKATAAATGGLFSG